MKIDINKKNSNSIDNPSYLISNKNLIIVDEKGRYQSRANCNPKSSAELSPSRKVRTGMKFGISQDSPFESRYTEFHPSSEAIQKSEEPSFQRLHNDNTPRIASLVRVPKRKGIFTRFCEKTSTSEKQRLLSFFQSKANVKHLLV